MIHLIETMLVRAGELVMSDVVSKRATIGYRGNWQCFGGLSLSIVPDLALQAVRTRDKVVMKESGGYQECVEILICWDCVYSNLED